MSGPFRPYSWRVSSKRAQVYALPLATAAGSEDPVEREMSVDDDGVHAVRARKRGRPRDPNADIRILEAAAGLILVRGFDNMTVDEVASRAKVGKATVYRRWARKEDLGLAALRQLYRSKLPATDTGSVRGDLRASYQDVVEFAASPSGGRHLRLAVAESMHDSRVRDIYRQAFTSAEEPTRECLRRGVDRGEVRSDIPLEYAAQWLVALVIARTVSARALPTPEEVEGLVELVLNGVAEPSR